MAFFNELLASAKVAANGHERAEALVSRFERSAVPATFGRDGILRAARDMLIPPDHVLVVIVEEEDRSFLPDGIRETAFSFKDGKFFAVRSALGWRPWFQGAVMLHEMVHWDDVVVTGREDPHDRMQNMMGEARAHALEAELIDRYTNGEFTRTLERVASEFALTEPLRMDASVRIPNQMGADFIASRWPDAPTNRAEASMRDAFAQMAFLLRQGETIYEQARLYGLASEYFKGG